MPDDQMGHTVNSGDIFRALERTGDKLGQLAESVARMDGTIEAISTRQASKEAEHIVLREGISKLKEVLDRASPIERLSLIETRVARIERYRFAIPGSAIVAIVAAAVAIVGQVKG